MSNELIPFGKYKGQPVEQLQHDPEYTKWLLQQPWFVEKYTSIQTLIVNNFKEAADTPEHNALQAKFLNRQLAFSVLSASLLSPRKSLQDWLDDDLLAFRKVCETCQESSFFKIEFEVEGWDVVISAGYFADGVLSKEHAILRRADREEISWRYIRRCELKPTIGEDFPSVLRQVKARKQIGCVITTDFSAKSVSFEDVKQMFAASGIGLVLLNEIELIQIPEIFVKAIPESDICRLRLGFH